MENDTNYTTPFVKIIKRNFSIHIYLTNSINYDANCEIFPYGDRGFMYSINGRGFYTAAEQIFIACENEGLKTLEGYMTKEHARLLRKACEKFATVDFFEEGTMENVPMIWVIVKRKVKK